MAEYINKQDVMNMFYPRPTNIHFVKPLSALIREKIETIPAADVWPVVRATNKSESGFLCSVCSFGDFGGFHGYKPNFCPNCGADMRGAPNGV